MDFARWLTLTEDAGSPSSKQLLYPLSYGGIGVYPPGDVITWGADALTYMDPKHRQLTFIWGDGFLSDPFEKDSLYHRIKGKQAPQMEDGKVVQQRVLGAGNLAKDDTGFKKTEYIQEAPAPNQSAWDYKQMGDMSGQLIPQPKYKLPS